MAEVLTIKQLNVDCPINTRNGCVEVNGNIYINTDTKLYKYSVVNKTFELILNKGNATTISICTDGDNLYMIRYVSGKNGYLCRYNIASKTYNDTLESLTWYTEYGSHYTSYLYFYNNSIYISLIAYRTYLYDTNYRYDLSNNTIVTEPPSYLVAAETQIVDNLFFGRYKYDLTFYKEIGSLRTQEKFGTYSSMPDDKTSGVFIHNGLYYIVYDTDIYTFNTNNNNFTKLNNLLPFSMGGSWVAGSNGDFYIFNYNKIINIKFVDYDISYDISNNDGSVVYVSLDNQLPLTNVRFNYTDGNTVGYIFNTLGDDIIGQFDIVIPNNKKLIGFSTTPNAIRANIPLNTDVKINIYSNTTFYASFRSYRPIGDTFDINLYQSSAEVNIVDKTDYLTSVGTLSGSLREECSIIAPSITFKQTSVPMFNYVYIASFGRYYYVTGITSVSKDIWRMSLSCDVLMTWKDEIRGLTAIIARQENSFNPLLIDSELPAQVNQNITVTEFPAGGFSTESAISYPFILTVVGA